MKRLAQIVKIWVISGNRPVIRDNYIKKFFLTMSGDVHSNDPHQLDDEIISDPRPTPRSRCKLSHCRRASALCIWAVCSACFAYFLFECFSEMAEKNQVSVNSDRSLLEHEAVARIKICNFVDLDPVKLREAAQNEGYREPVYKGHPLKATLLLDSENIVQLRLDLEKFVLGCEIYPFRKSCIEVFHWQLDSFGVCYVGELNIHATRKETPLLIDFYFDPELSRMNNISEPGAFVAVYHPDDFVLSIDGTFLGPKQTTYFAVGFVYRIQKQDFPKIQCLHRSGLETYNFTGHPFQTEYHVEACYDLCIAQYEYKHCGCATTVSWNITNTQCIQNTSKLECIQSYRNQPNFSKVWDQCNSLCLPKCSRKKTAYRVNNVYQKIAPVILQESVREWALPHHPRNTLAQKLKAEIEGSVNVRETLENISQNYARLLISMKNDDPIEEVTILPLMTFSTFIANFGGLVGMWLGLSAISMLQIVESFVCNFFLEKTDCPLRRNSAT